MTSPARAVRPPDGTSTRFTLLIVLVIASGLFTFYQLYFLVPANQVYFLSVFARCFADPRIGMPEPDGYELARHLLTSCQKPAFYDKLVWIVSGFVLLVLVAALVYATHPLRMKLLYRLEKPYVRGRDNHEVFDQFEDLARRMGLARMPTWYVSGRSTASGGGNAFGLPGRRCVRLDAALIPLHITNRGVFRTRVVHELAHLRNHDVDKTYWTTAIWWSFLAVIALPLFVFAWIPRQTWTSVPDSALWPTELTPYLVDRPFLFGQTLLLTILVYLARNAVLRARELHADATAVGCADADQAAPEELHRSRGPIGLSTWLRYRLGTHPTPESRIAVGHRPELAWRPTLWEPAAAGLSFGLLGTNLDLLIRDLFRDVLGKLNTFHGVATVGAALGSALGAVLAVSLWRSAVAQPDGQIRWRSCLTQPAMLVASLIGGFAVPLATYSARATPFVWASSRVWWGDAGVLAMAVIPLAVGAVLLAVWLRVATRVVLSAATSRLPMTAVVLTAALAACSWFAAWYVSLGTTPPPGSQLAGAACWLDGFTSGFFQAMACEPAFPGLGLTEISPLLLVGLMALWLVPLAVVARGDIGGLVRVAVAVGGTAGFLATLAGVGLAFWARAAVPEAERLAGSARALSFGMTYWHGYLAIAVLAQATAAFVVTWRAHQLRVVAGLLGGYVTAVVATVGQIGTYAAARCIDLRGTHPARCLPEMSVLRLSADLHTVALYGLPATIPAIVLAVAVARRSLPPLAQVDPVERRPTLVAGVVVCLVVVTVAAAVANLPLAWWNWHRWGAG